MVQWNDGTNWYNFYWGADNLNWVSRQYIGPLPPTGQWVRLEVPASLGMEGKTMSGMSFSLWDGRATFDKASKSSGSAPPPPSDTVWFDDATPNGAVLYGSGESWNWVGSNPAPYSAALEHQSALVAGFHNHYFTSATQTLSVGTGDKLFAYAYLDPANPPSEVMVQWNDGTNWYNFYWGADNLNWVSRQYIGPLPPTGQWVRLEVPASLGMEGKTMSGMSFSLWDGRVTFDKAGKAAAAVGSGSTNANITWLVTDQLGTPRMIFEKTGSLATTKRHDYLPFGEELFAGTGDRSTTQGYGANDNVRQKFTQKERDIETGLDYFLARYYSSTQARFTSVDPITIAANRIKDPQQLNLYVYARNNPFVFVDPNGQELEAVLFLSAVTGREEIGFLDDRVVSDFNDFVSSLEADGVTPRFNYLFRTTEEQQRLYDNRANNPNPVAVPGTSPHESGLAFDINRNGPDGLTNQGVSLEALRARGSNFGFYPIPSGKDPPHLQYTGIVPITSKNPGYLALLRENQESYRRYVALNDEFFGTTSTERGRGESDAQLTGRTRFLNQINRMDRADRQAGHPRPQGAQPRGMQVPPVDFVRRRQRG